MLISAFGAGAGEREALGILTAKRKIRNIKNPSPSLSASSLWTFLREAHRAPGKSEMEDFGIFTWISTCNNGDSFWYFWRAEGLTVPLGHPAICVRLFTGRTVDPGVLSQLSLLISLQVLQTLR